MLDRQEESTGLPAVAGLLGPEHSRLESLSLLPTGVKVPAIRFFYREQNPLSQMVKGHRLLAKKEKFHSRLVFKDIWIR